MGGRVTMRDVAKTLGVSTMTVSRALKDDGSVSLRTREAVRKTADELGYVYDTTAQAFRAGRSGFVAVTLPSINNANFAATHRALSDALSQTGLQILLGITGYSLDEEERLVRQLLARRPEALVLTGGAHHASVRDLIASLDIPVIEIWDLPSDPLGHVVGFSNAEAMAHIVSHLAESGHKKLAFLGAAGDSDRRGVERRRGAIEAAEQLGLPEVTLLEVGDAPVTMTDGARAVSDAGPAIREFDAIMCVSDPVAFGAISACRALGLKVPDDIAITGFGAFEIASVHAPPITTVEVGADVIGTEAGALIAQLLLGNSDNEDAQYLNLGARLLPGGTG